MNDGNSRHSGATAASRKRRLLLRFGSGGQSTIEYLIVTFALVAALISAPGIYESFSQTMANKYHSYSFGIAISDPPRKAFDDTVAKEVDQIEHIFKVLEEIEDLLSNSVFPDIAAGKLPSWGDVRKFGDLIKRLF